MQAAGGVGEHEVDAAGGCPLDTVEDHRARVAALGTAPAPRLFTEGSADDPGTALGAAEGLGPGWRGDGLLLAVVPPGRRGSPILRAYDPHAGGAAQDLGALPQQIGTPDSVRWDMARGQALIAVRRSGGDGQFDLWLVRWGGREGEARP